LATSAVGSGSLVRDERCGLVGVESESLSFVRIPNLVKGYKAGVTELPLLRDVSIFVTGLLDYTECGSR
jgi:hypothetical protein